MWAEFCSKTMDYNTNPKAKTPFGNDFSEQRLDQALSEAKGKRLDPWRLAMHQWNKSPDKTDGVLLS